MLSDPLILGSALFSHRLAVWQVAYWGDRAAEAGRSRDRQSVDVAALSLGVYRQRPRTFYGSVGAWLRTAGLHFLPVYLGPTLVLVLGWQLARRIVRISQRNCITSDRFPT